MGNIINGIKVDLAHIGGFINNNSAFLIKIAIVVGILAVISAVVCAVLTVLRKGLIEDVIFAGVFGLIFNVLGLLFVLFRKPVWNNLGWIPVVVAWFFINGNLTFSIILILYAVIWAFAQKELLDIITESEE